ncbi:MAG: hypothetical protein AB1813_00760, partial [Verrucomicrobiota bacterium]
SGDGALGLATRVGKSNAMGVWPKRCRALSRLPPQSKMSELRPLRYGVRRQNEVTTALWPWQCVWVNPLRWEFGQSGVARSRACHRTPK